MNSETVGVGTFFEASRFGCRKTIFDATKVTNKMYSCAISGMRREMMKMDGRDSAECQKWEKNDKMVIFGIKLEKDSVNSVVSYIAKGKTKTWDKKKKDAEALKS